MRIFRLETLRVLALCTIAIGGLSACGLLVSVPQLRDADNDEIVNIGDSVFAFSGDIFTFLHHRAGETWRHYAITGSQMVGGILAPPVPTQYDIARADDPNIRVVYMNGGGNDVLLQAILGDSHDCKRCNYWWCGDLSRSCKALIDDAYVEGVDLLTAMEADGVEQVVYLGYYYPWIGLFGDLTTLRKATDYSAAQTIAGIEDQAAGFAFYIDPRPMFSGLECILIGVDGIHPTEAGSYLLADLLWDVIDH